MTQSAQNDIAHNNLGFVVIGRNEGERLQACLNSIAALHDSSTIVYVDSGSTDGSVAFAKSLEVNVVELDMSIPFTAARARNEGWQHLLESTEGIEFVQFLDGDCKLAEGWTDKAAAFANDSPKAAVVCGRRREIHPENSIFNLFCDIEWDTPIGKSKSCGGDALIRVSALTQVNGYRPDVIAGEEPEMCVRLRQAGWEIHRIDAEMTLHDADITQIRQWWKRARRCGFAYALGASLHGGAPERHWVKETLRSCFWGGVVPFSALIASLFFQSIFPIIALLAVYILQILRLSKQVALPLKQRLQWAYYGQLSKYAEFMGVLEFAYKRLKGQAFTIIEYK